MCMASTVEPLHFELRLWPATRFVGPAAAGESSSFVPQDDLARARLESFKERLTAIESCGSVHCAICQDAVSSGAFVRVHCRIDAADEQCAEIEGLARECGFVCFDPQGPEIMHPARVGDVDLIVDALRSFEPGTHGYVVFSAGEMLDHYVQCWVFGDADRVELEAVANRFIAPEAQLSRAGIARLRLLGFRPPENAEGNFRREATLTNEADARAIASLIAAALTEAYGHSTDAPLDIRAFAGPIHEDA